MKKVLTIIGFVSISITAFAGNGLLDAAKRADEQILSKAVLCIKDNSQCPANLDEQKKIR